MIYGLIYLRIVPKDQLTWIKYCQIFSALPKQLQNDIRTIVDDLNEKYKSDLIVPFSYTPQTGAVVNPMSYNKIVQDLYDRYDSMMKKYISEPSIRIVVDVGNIENTDFNSVHKLRPEPVVVKVGHKLDSSDDSGIYRI